MAHGEEYATPGPESSENDPQYPEQMNCEHEARKGFKTLHAQCFLPFQTDVAPAHAPIGKPDCGQALPLRILGRYCNSYTASRTESVRYMTAVHRLMQGQGKKAAPKRSELIFPSLRRRLRGPVKVIFIER